MKMKTKTKTKTVKVKPPKWEDHIRYAYSQMYSGLRNMGHSAAVVVSMMSSLGLDQELVGDVARVFGDDLKSGG
jgi:hypothetical protein